MKNTRTKTDTTAKATVADGRHLRSKRSRAKIVDALFDVIRAGDMNPSAAQLAAKANVGIRTVFRHFDDVDGLYREMAAQMEAEILPVLTEPYTSTDWQGQLFELIDRRAKIYETILPVKVAANLRRFQSEYLMQDYERSLTIERACLTAILPESVLADSTLLATLEMLTGFNTWCSLRQDQGLSAGQSRDVIAETTRKLIGA